MDNNDNKGFQYTYSANEQAEIKSIREKYVERPKEEDKMERLRRLDASVGNKAQAISLVFGVIGLLVLGFGMSLIMSDLAVKMVLPEGAAMPLGLVFGVVGGVLAGLSYPMYAFILKRERERVAEEIIRLSDELLK
ncbi:MAG: hypothetical protein IJY65_02275 [Clostridia bacterium]|nr:hypothetical protein [Clostridia bacterium]